MLSAEDSQRRVVGIIAANPGIIYRDVIEALRTSYVKDGIEDPGFEAAKAEVSALFKARIIGVTERIPVEIFEEDDLSPSETSPEFQDYLREQGITKRGKGRYLVGSGMTRTGARTRLCELGGDMLDVFRAMPTAVNNIGNRVEFANSYGVFVIENVTD